MRPKIVILLYTVLLTLFLSWDCGAVEEKDKKADSVTITADEVEDNRKDNTIIGRGNVQVTYKEYSVQADEMELNLDTGFGTAKNHVTIHDRLSESNITCDQADFNIKSKKGTLYNGKGDFKKEYFFSGKKIDRIEEDKYQIVDGTVTSCSNTDTPPWMFKAKKVSVHGEHYAHLSHPTFWIKGVPVLYLPYLIVPVKTKRATGLLFPYVGTSDKDGYFINNAFFWAINEQSDATLYIDYMTKKGVRPGLEYRYTPSRQTKGELQTSYLKEKDTKKEFWKLNLDHTQQLPYNTKNVTSLDMTGGNNTDKAYTDTTNLRTRRHTDSYTAFTKNWDSSSLQLQARYRKSIEAGIDEKFMQLPEITFFSQHIQLGKTFFYFSQESSYTFFITDINNTSTEIQRADIHPTITLPFTKLRYLTFTPSAGVRSTLYSKGKDTNGNLTGGFSRELVDLHMDVEGPKVVKIFFDSQSSPRYKHLIEPRIRYSYLPDIDTNDRNRIWYRIDNGVKTTGFDAIDTIDHTHIVTYSLINHVLKKTARGTDEVLRLEIKNSYDIRETVTGRPFSTVRLDVDSSIFNPFIMNIDGEYSVYDKKIDTTNIEAGFRYENLWNISAERRYRRNTSTFWTGHLGVTIYNNLSLGYHARYDERSRLPLENDYSVKYTAQCWEVSVDLLDRTVVLGGQRQNELKFFVLITLKGIGSFGKKRK